MARRKKVARRTKKSAGGFNKTAEILGYMAANPEAGPKDVALALNQKGVDVTAQYVSTIKSNQKKKGYEPAPKSGGGDYVQQLIELKRVADKMGGIDNTQRALNLIRELQ